jgi:hypothetical protein
MNNLFYKFSKIIPCYCSYAYDVDPVYVDNKYHDLDEILENAIEKRYEEDQNNKVHIKTIIHCQRCLIRRNEVVY